jgi:hypothetical protein
VGHASRYSGLLRLEASRGSVSQSVLKTSGDVAPSRRLCRDQVKDGRVDAMDCIVPCYP